MNDNTATEPPQPAPAVGAQVDRRVRPPLEYATAAALYLAARRGEREFFLRYHGSKPRKITGIGLGDGCVWVEAGRMLPVHIYPNGTSKDGPAIWLEAA
jgi:hypothetical protein